VTEAAPVRKRPRRSNVFTQVLVSLPLLAALAVVVWLNVLRPDPAQAILDSFLVKQGQPLPDLPLEDRAGKESSLRDLAAGQRRVVILMDAACPHCHTELASLRELRKEAGLALSPVVVLAVGDPDVFGALAESYADLPMYSDVNREIRGKYRLDAVPALMVVEPGGTIREIRVGLQPKDRLRGVLAGQES
jgi:peroxiredoxin